MSHVLAGANEIIEYSPYRMGLLQMLRSGIVTGFGCRPAHQAHDMRQGLEAGVRKPPVNETA